MSEPFWLLTSEIYRFLQRISFAGYGQEYKLDLPWSIIFPLEPPCEDRFPWGKEKPSQTDRQAVRKFIYRFIE